ncbi:MAG: septal ring lytic transglycosylase RlpA family protein, partial [Treponema sp.]|nr:septal ring lytic transglycosylase RlpA family protein [Treponema sp.]
GPLMGSEAEVLKLEALASFYAEDFHGRPTASGELFDMHALTAAHKTLPFGTMLEITNLENGKRVTVRVNDRGPFIPNREIDLSRGAAEKIDMISAGVARVSIRKLSGPSGQEGTLLVKTAGPASDFESGTASTGQLQPTPAPVQPVADAGAVQSAATGVKTWRIQLASFSLEANATRMALTLRDQGFSPAFEKAASMIRVVLPGVADTDLAAIRSRLESAGYRNFLVRQESR